MRILRLNAYLKPEITASRHLLDDLYCVLARNKIECICYTPQPTRGVSEEEHRNYKKYEELHGGYVKIHRFPMFREGKNPIIRAIRYFLCAFIQYYKGCKERNIDVVYSSSTPPIQGMLSALVAKNLSAKEKKKIPFVYSLQDVFPDSLVNSKLAKEGSLFWKLGRYIENYTYRNSDKIIVISNAMKKNLLGKGVPEDKIEVVSNWIDIDAVKPVSNEENTVYQSLNLSEKDFKVLYAGNFGEAQGAEIIIDVAGRLKSYSNIKFIIFGGGANFEKVKQKAVNMNNVIVNGLLPVEFVPQVYSLGDVALITCKKGTGGAGMPSKTWSIMACNTPIIASFDKESELAAVLKLSGAGECVEPENVDELELAVLKQYKMFINDQNTSLNLRSYVEKYANKVACTQKYIDILSYEYRRK